MQVDLLTATSLREHKVMFGILRYILETSSRVRRFGIRVNEISYPPSQNSIISNLRLFVLYPLQAWFSLKSKVAHITSQTHAFLLLLPFFSGRKTILTVYDIYPYAHPERFSAIKNFITRLNMKGAKRADKLIAISNFTKNELVNRLGIPSGKIGVVYPGVDTSHYRPQAIPKNFLREYSLPRRKTVLYVGSEEPRQNLETLARALGILKEEGEGFLFLKVGKPSWPDGRALFLELLEKHGLQSRTRIIDNVPEEDMPYFYNYSTVCVYPCSYTGFGLPPLEAMASGCPVVTSNAASLPEIVGDAGIMLPAKDAQGFAAAIRSLLNDSKLREKYSLAGVKRAKRFNWDIAARQTAAIYKQML